MEWEWNCYRKTSKKVLAEINSWWKPNLCFENIHYVNFRTGEARSRKKGLRSMCTRRSAELILES
ncbi:hypothetical protein BpHYR1_036411 [Brachionus plicatilis]|uniref:Uncharacterized protein n=1 Tax=Brachionus plicatilis TaxID=10195 RepID=A0A3M7SJ13_BRAPC|nr:hypothetical protein BpHYR1_036411 [Brachionus plicatilis]